jgi:elongation factor Ts
MSITASQVAELRASTGAGLMDCKKALEATGGDLAAAKDYLRKKGIAIAQKKSARETKEGAVAVALSEDRRTAAIVRLACETDFVARNEQFQTLVGQLARQVLARGASDVPQQALAEGKGTVAELITQAIATTGENLQFVEAARIEAPAGAIGGYVHSNAKIGVLVAVKAEGALAQEMPAADKLTALARDIAMHVAASQVSAIRPDEVPAEVMQHEKDILAAQAKESGKPAEIIEKMVQGRLNKYLKDITLLSQPFVKNPEQTIEQLLAEQGKALGAKLSVERYVKFAF